MICCEADVCSHLDSRPSLPGNWLTGLRVRDAPDAVHPSVEERENIPVINFEHIRVRGIKVRALF